MDVVSTKIIEILAEVLGVSENRITNEADLVDDLGAESIDFVDICYQLERTFGINKILLSDIYPYGLRDLEFNKTNLDEIVQKYTYLENNMKQIIENKQSFIPIRSVNGLIEYIQWRLNNEGKE